MKTLFIHCKIGPHFVHKGFAKEINADIIKCCYKIGSSNIILLILESFFRGFLYSFKKYDVIISEGMEGIYLAKFINFFSKNTKILYHDADVFFYRDYPNYKGLSKKIINYFLSGIDFIISDSEISKKYITKYINKPIEIVYPYVNSYKFLEIYKTKKENKNIIYIGRFAEEKNLFELLKAFINLQKKYTNIKLRLIGKGPLKKDIKFFIKKRKIKNIEIINWTPDLGKYLNDSYIGYNVSEFEPFGCNGLEYSLAGLIPILGKNNGNIEIFNNKNIICKKDFVSIEKKLNYLLEYKDSNELIKELQKKAKIYTKENQTKDFQKKFYKLINLNEKK